MLRIRGGCSWGWILRAAAGTGSDRHSGASYAHAEDQSTLRTPRRPLDPLIPRTLDPFKLRGEKGEKREAGRSGEIAVSNVRTDQA